jgi:hypothetical protein
MNDDHDDPKATRIATLRELLKRLTSPDLTIAEARAVQQRLDALLGVHLTPAEPGR